MPEFHTISNIFIKIGFRNADKRQDNGVGFAKQFKKWRQFVRHCTDLIFHFALYIQRTIFGLMVTKIKKLGILKSPFARTCE